MNAGPDHGPRGPSAQIGHPGGGLVAGSADPTIIAAFAVGFVSFISPCVLPLVPGYLSAVSGVSIAEMRSGERSTLKILLPAIVFCLSFTHDLRGPRDDGDRPRLDACRAHARRSRRSPAW